MMQDSNGKERRSTPNCPLAQLRSEIDAGMTASLRMAHGANSYHVRANEHGPGYFCSLHDSITGEKINEELHTTWEELLNRAPSFPIMSPLWELL